MTRILAIDTSSAWCSVALSLGNDAPLFRHEQISAGASGLLLPWIEEMLIQACISLKDLDAIAVGVGPGAFTGVRLGVAAVQGLALAANLPVLPIASLDAVAAQTIATPQFSRLNPKQFVVAVDARMDEVYWAKYQAPINAHGLPLRDGEIHLSKPEELELSQVQYIVGSAIDAFGDRLFINKIIPSHAQDASLSISALGILDVARERLQEGKQIHVQDLEPLYVRNKVALTTQEREMEYKKASM